MKTYFLNFCLVVVSIIITGFCTEIGMRIADFDFKYGSIKAEDLSIPDDRFLASLNTFSPRGYNHLPKKSYKIVVLGDSMSWGWGINYAESYPGIIEEFLNINNANSNLNYEVINLSIPGINTKQQARIFEDYLKNNPEIKPNLVLLGYNFNDTESKSKPQEKLLKFESIIHWMNSQRYSVLAKRIGVFLDLNYMSQRKFVQRYLPLYNPEYPGYQEMLEGLDKIKKLVNDQEAKVIMPIFPSLFAQDSHIKQAMQQIEETLLFEAKKRGFYTIPLLDYLLKWEMNELVLTKKDEHPNLLGQRLIANRILQYIIKNNIIPFEGKIKNVNFDLINPKKNPIKLETIKFPKGTAQNGIYHYFNRGGIMSKEYIYHEDLSTDHENFKLAVNETLHYSKRGKMMYFPKSKFKEDPIATGKWDIPGTLIGVYSKDPTDLIYNFHTPQKYILGQLEVNIASYENGAKLNVSQACNQQINWSSLVDFLHKQSNAWIETGYTVNLKPCKGNLFIRFSGSTPAGNDWLSIRNFALKLTYPEKIAEKRYEQIMYMNKENAKYFRESNRGKVE